MLLTSVIKYDWYLAGKCFPGWRDFDNKCYWYFGGVVMYAEAEALCKVCSTTDCTGMSAFLCMRVCWIH